MFFNNKLCGHNFLLSLGVQNSAPKKGRGKKIGEAQLSTQR